MFIIMTAKPTMTANTDIIRGKEEDSDEELFPCRGVELKDEIVSPVVYCKKNDEEVDDSEKVESGSGKTRDLVELLQRSVLLKGLVVIVFSVFVVLGSDKSVTDSCGHGRESVRVWFCAPVVVIRDVTGVDSSV